MALPLIPLGVWIAGGVVAGIGAIAGLAYAFSDDDKDKKPKKPKKIIFLTGEVGVGKDTVRGILQSGEFIEYHKATAKPHKSELINLCGYDNVLIYNTGGADGQSSINKDKRRELIDSKESGIEVYYVYVFDANEYFSDSETKETIDRRLKTAKKFVQSEDFEFKIIGTHRDTAQKYEAKMSELMNEFRQNYGECEIYDLTKAKTQGKQVQQQLVDFIIGEE